MIVYNVHAYRFADRERHSYLVGIYSTKKKAETAAQKEEDYRGGNKYFCEILELEVDSEARKVIRDLKFPVVITSCISRIHYTAISKSEGTPLPIALFKDFGSPNVVSRSLARLVSQGVLFRASRGLYFLATKTKFGSRPPSAESIVSGLADFSSDLFALHGAAIAKQLGITNQVPQKKAFLTSGKSRKLVLSDLKIELTHAPNWQLLPGRIGDLLRVIAWVGKDGNRNYIVRCREVLKSIDLKDIVNAKEISPRWVIEFLDSYKDPSIIGDSQGRRR